GRLDSQSFLLEVFAIERDEIRDLVHLADRAANRDRDLRLLELWRLRERRWRDQQGPRHRKTNSTRHSLHILPPPRFVLLRAVCQAKHAVTSDSSAHCASAMGGSGRTGSQRRCGARFDKAPARVLDRIALSHIV